MNSTSISGVYTALITPFFKGNVCYEDLEKLVEYQIKEGIDGIIPVGTTGESPTLKPEEHIEVIRYCVEISAGRVPVITGTGANSTEEAVDYTKKADEAGADGFLQVAPYYNKPSQEGLFRHFGAIAEITDKPIVLYSIPSRCGIEIAIDTVERLRAQYPHVNTIKEAGGSCDRVCQLINAMGNDITVISGDDSLTLPFMSVGAKGVISVASNLDPGGLMRMVHAALDNDYTQATELHIKLYPLFKNLFIETSPVPIKSACAQAGIIRSPEVRLPLFAMSASNQKILDHTLDELGIKVA